MSSADLLPAHCELRQRFNDQSGSVDETTEQLDSGHIPRSFADLLASLPSEVYEPSKRRALANLLVPLAFCVSSVYILANFPWYFLPIGWFVLGTAVMGFVTVAKDCEKEKFVRSKLLNDLIGTLCLLPVMMPFEAWKNHKSNVSESLAQSPFWIFTSTWEWLRVNCKLTFSPKMVVNMIMLYTFICIFFPLLAYNVGWWGVFKYYFIPFIVYHFWMSSYLKVNYSLAFADGDGPLICSVPKWLQLMTNNYKLFRATLNEKAAAIPSYNFNDFRRYLAEHFGDASPEISFGSALIRSALSSSAGQPAAASSKKPAAAPTPVTAAAATVSIGRSSIESELNWPTILWIVLTPLLSLYGLLACDFYWQTYLIAFVSYFTGGMGITTGYHRLFSHRSYQANQAWRVFWMLLGTQTFEGSVLDWCFDHRDHHRFTDTELDPYNAKRGFFFSHMGWLFFKRDRQKVLKSDISDLTADPFLRFQHEWYTTLAFSLGIFLPMFVCGLAWGDWLGGLLIAGFASKVVTMQCTFCINSVAHYWGNQPFSDQRTPCDYFLTSLLTFGEGYHNYHHEFPNDYRNGVFLLAYDPAKWVIWFGERIGWTFDVKRMSQEMIHKGILQMAQKKLDEAKSKWHWGPELHQLPEWTADQVARSSKHLIIIDQIVYDVGNFVDEHPGGRGFLIGYRGRDASKAFNGSVYNHSNCARNILRKLAVARLLPVDSFAVQTSDQQQPITSQ